MNTSVTKDRPFVQDNIEQFRARLVEDAMPKPELSKFEIYWPNVFGLAMGLFALWVIHFYGWVR